MIDITLRTAMLAHNHIANKVSGGTATPATGVYPQNLPQDASLPCVVYRIHDGIPDLIANGTSDVMRYTADFQVFTESYGSMRELTQSVVSFLHGLSLKSTDDIQLCKVHNIHTEYLEKLNLYTSTVDTTLIVKES